MFITEKDTLVLLLMFITEKDTLVLLPNVHNRKGYFSPTS